MIEEATTVRKETTQPTEPGDYAVMTEDGCVAWGRVYAGPPSGPRFREKDVVSGEWLGAEDAEGDGVGKPAGGRAGDWEVTDFPGPWARFPDGTFGEGW